MMKRFTPYIPILVSVITPLIAGAQSRLNVNNVSDVKNKVLCPIVSVMFWTFIAIAVIMVLWSAFLYLSSGGDTEKVKTATKSLTYAAVAVVVAILANSFPLIVGSIFKLNGDDIAGCPTR